MRVFVTGGNGFIGSVVLRMLIEQRHSVRCLLRAMSKTERIDGLAFERVEGDVRDAASVRAGMEGCQGVIHLASLSSWNDIDSPLMDEVVAGGTKNVLDAALARPVGARPRVVFVSSSLAVNGSKEPRIFDESADFTLADRKLNYSRCKLLAEAMCKQALAAGVPTIIVNPGEVYGPNDRDLITAGNLIDFARSTPVLVCSGGTSVVYVDDVALAIVRALERGTPGERYILSGENLTVKQLAELCIELLGQKKSILKVPNAILKGITAVAVTLHIPLPFNPHVVPYATLYWFMDSSKAQRELGVSFRSARETLGPTLRWLKESGRMDASRVRVADRQKGGSDANENHRSLAGTTGWLRGGGDGTRSAQARLA
jgi:dihydroflavonol-4-reductase